MNHETDVNATVLLGIACKDLREGRASKAQHIFGGLAVNREFSYRGLAAYGEAIAMAHAGMIQEAFDKLKSLLDGFTDPTMLRAKILRAFAETSIKLGQFDGVDDMLKEAAEIFKTQGELHYLGAVVSLQGVVATIRGTDLKLPINNFSWAERFGEAYFPDFVPEQWITDQQTEIPSAASSQTVLAGAGIS